MRRAASRIAPVSLLIAASLAIASNPSVAASTYTPEPMIQRLIGTALTASPILNARRSDLAATRSDVDAARWQYAPSVSADVEQGSNSPALNGRLVRIDQKLYTGGRLDADVHGAIARRDSAVYGVQESALTLALQIIDGYQALAAANSQLVAIDAYQKRLDGLDATISRRIESGVSASADRSLMNARMAQSRNDLAGARAAQRSAITTLDKLVGEPTVVHAVADTITVTASDTSALPDVCGDNGVAETRMREALAAHPSLHRIERDIESARSNVQSQRAALMPTLGLRLEQPIAPGNDAVLRSTRVSLVLQYTPDAGLSTLARAQGANDRVASLVNQADALQRDVTQQIRAECAQQSGVIERVAGYAQARGYTSEVLASNTRLFIAGKRGWLDLLNAAREDFDNEQAGIVAGAALVASRSRLALLTGEQQLNLPGVSDEPPSNLGNSVRTLLK